MALLRAEQAEQAREWLDGKYIKATAFETAMSNAHVAGNREAVKFVLELELEQLGEIEDGK